MKKIYFGYHLSGLKKSIHNQEQEQKNKKPVLYIKVKTVVTMKS